LFELVFVTLEKD